MKKSFKLTHKPGHALLPTVPLADASAPTASEEPAVAVSSVVASLAMKEPGRNARIDPRPSLTISASTPAAQTRGNTTRKTIEVPEEYFYQVKMRALQRRIKEKDLWAEILEEYFAQHLE